ncbi:hypothetical protein O181_062520 [Austropuccinia psidii MF-1]|uniref:Uncharacterized protein n=1 Tax=Austropuccinia psidii MF-1 TaxID=1389203 RepID=A0A9Q3I1E7_9BASI|nr:hypothetical protein [Austropuccinia psidii MF-1]
MGFKHQKKNPPNPPQQDSPVTCMPQKKPPRPPTPGLSGTQWSEDLFCCKQLPFLFLILTFASSELTLPLFVEPSQHNEPPIPGPSQSSKPHEDALTCRPEPEVAVMQSMEEPFACPATPTSIIIINDMPFGAPTPPPSPPTLEIPPSAPRTPAPSSPHYQDEACQEFTNLKPTLMIP